MTVSELIEALKEMPQDMKVTHSMIKNICHGISYRLLEDIERFLCCRLISKRRRFIDSLDSNYRDEFIKGLESFFDCLTQREKNILQKIYGVFSGRYSLKRIASLLDLCPARVRQIAERANRKLIVQLRDMKYD